MRLTLWNISTSESVRCQPRDSGKFASGIHGAPPSHLRLNPHLPCGLSRLLSERVCHVADGIGRSGGDARETSFLRMFRHAP